MKKRFAVIGLGNFGMNVGRALYELGHEVIAIDFNKNRVAAADPYCTEGVILDATDREAVSSLGLENMNSVIVCTGAKISNSILICLYLHELGVKNIIVKASDDDHAKILKKVGASEIIHPEKDMAVRVARNLSTPNVMDFVPLGEDFNLIQIAPPKDFLGKSLKQLNIRSKFNVHIIAVKSIVPEKFMLVPSPDFIIKDSDILVILGKSEDTAKVEALP